jgi:hypothetical protein
MLITPQYTSGSVPGFAGAPGTGLLQTFVDWVTGTPATPGLDWTIEHESESMNNDGETASFDGTYKEYILKNTGLSGTEEIFIGFREYAYAAGNEYNIELNGYTSLPISWNGNQESSHQLDGWGSTRKHYTELPVLQLFDNEIHYWFYSTPEFVAICTRVSTSYYQAYLGNIVRYGSPGNYPHPLYIAGSNVGNVNYQTGGYGPVRPTTASPSNSFLFGPDGTVYKGGNLLVWPMEGHSTTNPFNTSPNGAVFMVPVIFRGTTNGLYITMGEAFNIAAYRIYNALSESVYTDSNVKKWRVFAQGKNDYAYDFMSIYEIPGTTTTTSSTTTTTV